MSCCITLDETSIARLNLTLHWPWYSMDQIPLMTTTLILFLTLLSSLDEWVWSPHRSSWCQATGKGVPANWWSTVHCRPPVGKHPFTSCLASGASVDSSRLAAGAPDRLLLYYTGRTFLPPSMQAGCELLMQERDANRLMQTSVVRTFCFENLFESDAF